MPIEGVGGELPSSQLIVLSPVLVPEGPHIEVLLGEGAGQPGALSVV